MSVEARMEDLHSLRRSWWRVFWGLLILWPLLVSCSAFRITYSTADWILLWKLDSYFDLSAPQEEYLEQRIKLFHGWHRHHQLPQYAEFLRQIDQSCEDGLSQAELESIFASVEHFRAHLAKQASPPGAIFLSTITPAQIRYLQDELEQEHRRLVSENGKKSEVRIEKRIASTLQPLTSWLGELSVDQETHIREWIKEVPDITDVWLAHRRSRQARLLELLNSSHDPVTLEQGLYDWLADSKSGATADYLVASRVWREWVEKVVLKIDQILTRDQRAHVSRKLQELIQDIEGLVGQDIKQQVWNLIEKPIGKA